GNGSYTASDRHAVAQRLRTARAELLLVANTPDGAGGYVFGGQGTTSAPFDPSGASPTYRPTAGEQTSGLDSSYATSQDGRVIFGDGGSPAGDIFSTLDTAIRLLEDPASIGTALSDGLQAAMKGIDSSQDRLLLARTRAGEQLRGIDVRERLLDSGALEARGQLSELVDVDYAAAISRFQGNQTALEAAMATYAKISRLSLFDYL
ncbi:MAG: hypothetical protein ACLGHY_11730, partial [Gammaproteobacteria bacterium]